MDLLVSPPRPHRILACPVLQREDGTRSVLLHIYLPSLCHRCHLRHCHLPLCNHTCPAHRTATFHTLLLQGSASAVHGSVNVTLTHQTWSTCVIVWVISPHVALPQPRQTGHSTSPQLQSCHPQIFSDVLRARPLTHSTKSYTLHRATRAATPASSPVRVGCACRFFISHTCRFTGKPLAPNFGSFSSPQPVMFACNSRHQQTPPTTEPGQPISRQQCPILPLLQLHHCRPKTGYHMPESRCVRSKSRSAEQLEHREQREDGQTGSHHRWTDLQDVTDPLSMYNPEDLFYFPRKGAHVMDRCKHTTWPHNDIGQRNSSRVELFPMEAPRDGRHYGGRLCSGAPMLQAPPERTQVCWTAFFYNSHSS